MKIAEFEQYKVEGQSEAEKNRAVFAKKAALALEVRPPQVDIYSKVQFSSDHILPSAAEIPLTDNELILAPGHVDPLFILDVLKGNQLYSIIPEPDIRKAFTHDNSVLEGSIVDTVFGKLNLKDALISEDLNHPEVNTIFLQMIEQQVGNLSVKELFEVSRREIHHFRTQPDAEKKIAVLIAEVRNKIQRIVRQEVAGAGFIESLRLHRPRMSTLYKSDGKTLFVDSIQQKIVSDIGPNPKTQDINKFTEAVITILLRQK